MPFLDFSSASARIPTSSIFLLIFSFRLLNALTIKTFFQPDEYFQALEPAWQTAFGPASGAWITWEWHEGLRSSIPPFLIAGIYRIAASAADVFDVRSDTRAQVLVAMPKLLGAFVAAVIDLHTWKLGIRTLGRYTQASQAALLLSLCNPFMWFFACRTFSNSLEASSMAFALERFCWKWYELQEANAGLSKRGKLREGHVGNVNGELVTAAISANGQMEAKEKGGGDDATAKSGLDVATNTSDLYLSLVAAATACVLRPTNFLIWATLSLGLAIRNPASTPSLLRAAVIAGSAVLSLSLAFDRAFYGQWTLPPLRFIYFNVVQSLAVFYGRNRHDYYLTEGLPLLLTTALPFAAAGMWQALIQPDRMGIRSALAWTVATSVVALSLISHKEVRFLFPLIPMIHVLAAEPLAEFFGPAFRSPWRAKARLAVLLVIVFANLGIGYYTAYIHQRGVIDVMHYLQEQQEARFSLTNGSAGQSGISMGFLMPCHSTPWRSHLVHPEIRAWALTCEPPLTLSLAERQGYLDEADVFYLDPVAWLRKNMLAPSDVRDGVASGGTMNNTTRAWPEYLIFFEQLEKFLQSMDVEKYYAECWRGFNTHWHDDWRRKGDVVVWCLH